MKKSEIIASHVAEARRWFRGNTVRNGKRRVTALTRHYMGLARAVKAGQADRDIARLYGPEAVDC